MALLIGAAGCWFWSGRRAFFAILAMMVLFFHAARLAMVVFDPYMSSRPLASALLASPSGKLIVNHHYYEFSSIFFYTNRSALLLNGRFNNLVYGSYAPTSPPVFIDDTQFENLWQRPERYYFVADRAGVRRIEGLPGAPELDVVAASGGKFLITNHPLPNTKRLSKAAG